MRLTKTQRYLRISHSLREVRFKISNYKLFGKDGDHTRNIAVFCTDPRVYAGGMCDRFKGMICAYAWAKANGYDFRIIHHDPYELSDYLKPAAIDWIPKEGEISKTASGTKLFLCRSEKGERFLKYNADGRQLHYYGNIDFLEKINAKYGCTYKWGELFKELFVPSAELQELIGRFTPDGEYVSASFRFQKLLGDFDEKYHSSLGTLDERQALIDACLEAIRGIMNDNPGKRVLVTSDSTTFIEEAAKIDGVFTVPGKRVHVQYDTSASADDYMTCFLDFYLLTGSQKLYRVCKGKMYKTGFPVTAAMVNDRPIIDIDL